MTTTETLKLALEALLRSREAVKGDYDLASCAYGSVDPDGHRYQDAKKAVNCVKAAITALRTAIEQAEKQEPVAEVKLKTTGGNVGIATVIHEIYSHYREPLRPGDKLYTTPPASPGYIKGDTRSGLVDNDFEENT
jgi:hypothetical protein